MKLASILIALLASSALAATRGWQAGETSAREAPNRLATGKSHTCVALYDGSVRCWGTNNFGQLGNSSTVSSPVPVTVQRAAFLSAPPLSLAIAVKAGDGFTCALTADGKVSCWGRNDGGQLGDLSTTNRQHAVPVFNLVNAVRIVAGQAHACALLANGTVKCWGSNVFGQLGDNSTATRVLPVTVSGLTGATDIAAGNTHTCALVAGGTAQCWGNNQFGQLGNGNNTNSLVSVAVTSLTDAFALTVGGEHSCAITPNGITRCWGRNTDGQLGNGDFTSRSSPVNAIQANIASIRAGRAHTCAVTAAGLAKCWGRNADGQLGNGSTIVQPVPVSVTGLSLIIGALAGGDHSCAMAANGTVTCWGDGAFGQLGNGGTVDVTTPAPVTGIAGGVSAKSVTASEKHTCALRANGAVSCWGGNAAGGTEGFLGNGGGPQDVPNPTLVAGLTGVSAISSSSIHTCALIADGTVKCWGSNGQGQTGNGNRLDQTTPFLVPGLTDVVSIKAGSLHTCALLVTGTSRCWGFNSGGRFGDGTTQSSFTPVPTSIQKAVSLGTGSAHSCASFADGSASCWGNGQNGQLGNGTLTSTNVLPVSVAGLSAATAIFAAGQHTCALDAAGLARCWGQNGNGQVGNGAFGVQLVPRPVSGLNLSVMMAGSAAHTCAVEATGAVQCWGFNGAGAVGTGTIGGNLTSPVPILNLLAVTAIATGQNTCAVRATGSISCWGENSEGQLGDGGFTRSAVPVTVPSFTLNIVPTAQLSSSNARKLRVNIVANCEVGERLQLRVEVAQGNVSGRGTETADCTGVLDTFPVEVHAQGPRPFVPGSATVEADAIIRNRGDRERQQWTRVVQIVP